MAASEEINLEAEHWNGEEIELLLGPVPVEAHPHVIPAEYWFNLHF